MNNLGTPEQGIKVYRKIYRWLSRFTSDVKIYASTADYFNLQSYINRTRLNEILNQTKYTDTRKMTFTVFMNGVQRKITIIKREANQGANLIFSSVGPAKGSFNPDTLAGQVAFTSTSLQLSGNNVLSWGDSLGGGKTLPGVNSPQYFATGGPNNLPYVKLSGGSYFTQSGVGVPLTGTPADMFFVIRTPTIDANVRLFEVAANGGSNGFMYTSPTTGKGSYVYTGVAPFYLGETKGAVPRTEWMVLRIRWTDIDTLRVQVNDEVYLLNAFATPGSDPSAYAFAFFQLAYPNSEIAEFRLFNNILSEADALKVKQSLMAKYAISRPTKRMVVCGDSHTVGVQSGPTTGNPYVGRILANTGYTVNMLAANSTCAVNQNGPIDIQFVGYADELATYADTGYYVVINYGTNDCATASGGYGWTSWSQWKADFKAKVQALITAGFAANRIIMVTPPYSTGGYVAGNLTTVRTLITEIKNELGTNFVDWSQLMIDAGLDAATLSGGDGIHVNDACHQLVYNGIIAITGV